MKKIVKLTVSSILSLFLFVATTSDVIAGGNDIQLNAGLSSGDFKDLSKQVGLMISYIPLAPAEPLGITGFDLGVEMTASKINSGVREKAVSDSKPPDY